LGDVIKYFPNITREQWLAVKGIGEKSAESLASWFGSVENITLLKKMESLGVEIEISQKIQSKNSKLSKKTFVLTGELSGFTREQAKDIIRKAGGDVSSSVSKKTDYVLAGENPGSKLQKARELGVKIIDEEGFVRLVGK
jgi:DNA ligase (NAD+)